PLLSLGLKGRGAPPPANRLGRPCAASPDARLDPMKARVLIRPKEGILDPQGKAVGRALAALGVDGSSARRGGRLVELEAEDGADLDRLCEQLLANPLI